MTKVKEPKTSLLRGPFLFLLGMLLLLLIVLAVTTHDRLRHNKALMEEFLVRQGGLIISYLEGASRVGMRFSAWENLLQNMVNEMANYPQVRMLIIVGANGKVLASVVSPKEDAQATIGRMSPEILKALQNDQPVTQLLGESLVVGRSFESYTPPRHKRWDQQDHHGDFRGPPPLRAYALVWLSTEDLYKAITRDVRQALYLAVIIFLAVAGLATVVALVVRRRNLEVERMREEINTSRHLAAVGRLAGSVAHEVRNPLSALRGLVQYIAKDFAADDKRAEYAALAVEEVDRLERVVSGLLEYARPRQPRLLPVELGESLRGVMMLMHDDPRAQHVDMKLEMPEESIMVQADPDQLRQLLVNLMVNALEALNGQGWLHLRARRQAGRVIVEVEDNGPGLPEEDPEQLFDPFYTTRARGTGLGLALARRMARAHGGDLTARSLPQGGAMFSFDLMEDA